MDRDNENDKIDNEIFELNSRLKELKKGYERTIHDFAKGKIN